MSWLRIDDGFADHPKMAVLTDREYRVWTKVLCYCARYRDPTIDAATIGAIKDLDAKKVARYEQLGLLDVAGEMWVIHDWSTYAPKDPSNAERQAKWRANRNGHVTAGVTDA